LFGALLVQYGMSFRDKRSFPDTYRYLDTIVTLAPTYARPYLMADTLLTMLPQAPEPAAYARVHALHQRGLEALPYLTELWSVAGQFAAYLAPPRVPPEQRQELKMAGARLLSRACELAGGNANIPYHCISAARILEKAGERDAMARMLARTLAVQDDPEVRKLVRDYLEYAQGVRRTEENQLRVQRLEAEWKRELPHASRNLMSLLGPGTDVWRCSGPGVLTRPGCASSWRQWNDEPFSQR
jgi:hypothetical protein